MSNFQGLDILRNAGWEVQPVNFADVLAQSHFSAELAELAGILTASKFSIEDSIIKRGGGLADQTQELAARFKACGWRKNNIKISSLIEFQNDFDPIITSSTSHEIDHLKRNGVNQTIALEIEWNNKDEFFDRDFQSIRRLYDLNVIDLGIIITRGQTLEDGLLDMIADYFEKSNIKRIEDFRLLHKRFTDASGRERFSFPTNPQARKIKNIEKNSAKSFSQLAAEVFKSDKFSGTTTNWRQLQKRIERRDAGRSPILCLGMPRSLFK